MKTAQPDHSPLNGYLHEILLKLFGGSLDAAMLQSFEAAISWQELKSGEYLFKQNDAADAIYIVVAGRLQVCQKNSTTHIERTVGEVKHGEIVGKMAMFPQEKRSASIFALRDCVLARLSHTEFQALTQKYPQIFYHITHTTLKRLNNPSAQPKIGEPKAEINNIAIVAANEHTDLNIFAKNLNKALSNIGKTLLLNPQNPGKNADLPQELSEDDPDFSYKITTWLAQKEQKNRFILYQTDPDPSPWTLRSLRQADLILVVADAQSPPYPSPQLKKLLYHAQPNSKANIYLALLHPPESTPQNTAIWLQNYPAKNHFHIQNHTPESYNRLARIVAGKCIGLVLGGGGARGLAHIGIIKALREHHIPIDAVGGTSMGAVIGTSIALNWQTESMEEICKKTFSNWRLLKDYTLPTVSIIKGKTADEDLQKIFGNTQIEDMWLNYFCVSSNLATSDIEIHQSGSLAQALRASASLPVIFPPLITNQKMLIDGGLINNLPADIMYQKFGGKTILADVMAHDNLEIIGKKKPSLLSFLLEKTLNIPQKNRTPDILEIILRASLINSSQKTKHLRTQAAMFLQPPVKNFGLLDMGSITKIAEIGYQYTNHYLENLSQPIDQLLGLKTK